MEGFLLLFAYLLCNCGQPAASQGASRKRKFCERPHRATLVSMVNNCSEVFLKCLSKPKQRWHWIRMKTKQHCREKQRLRNGNLMKWSLCLQISWITSDLALGQSGGNKCTVLLKANGLHYNCWTGKFGGWICPDLKRGNSKAPHPELISLLCSLLILYNSSLSARLCCEFHGPFSPWILYFLLLTKEWHRSKIIVVVIFSL